MSSPARSTRVAESAEESCSSNTLLRAKPWDDSAPKSLNCGQQTGMPPLWGKPAGVRQASGSRWC